MSTKVYTPEGLFDFTSEPAIEALKLMKQIMAYSNPDILLEGGVRRRRQRHAGRNRLRGAARRPLLQILQRAAAHGGELGRSEASASWAAAEVHKRRGLDRVLDDGLRAVQIRPEQRESRRIHQGADLRSADLEGLDRRHAGVHPGQLPPYKSIYAGWNANKPDWMPPFVGLVRSQLDQAKAIDNNLFGLQQFVIGKPIWETYLKGEEPDPKVAMTEGRWRPCRPKSRRADRAGRRRREPPSASSTGARLRSCDRLDWVNGASDRRRRS